MEIILLAGLILVGAILTFGFYVMWDGMREYRDVSMRLRDKRATIDDAETQPRNGEVDQ